MVLDLRFEKIVVGLALENAIVHRRDIQDLLALYSEPEGGRIRELHDQLIASDDPYDREVAIWLEPALDLGPLKSDPHGLVREMREMEQLLYILINQAGGAQKEVNYWMNYIANAAQFILDGFWIDAKVMLSRALQSSRSQSINGLKSIPSLSYKVDVLQRATASYFEEAKDYPLGLQIQEAMMDPLSTVQEIMLSIMRDHYRRRQGEGARLIRQTIHRLSSAMRYMMREGKVDEAQKELVLATRYIDGWLDMIDDETRESANEYHKRIEDVISVL
ncbi:MAG: hypothetical protein ACETVY_02960 [Candidatus Bathyarchaeia archaeon]